MSQYEVHKTETTNSKLFPNRNLSIKYICVNIDTNIFYKKVEFPSVMIEESQIIFYKKIAYNLYALRKSKGWSQEYLSNLSGVERSKISRIENFSEDFLLSTVLRLAIALGVSFEVLLNQNVEIPKDFSSTKY